MKKAIFIILVIIILAIGALLLYVRYVLPSAGPLPQVKVELNPGKIARGKYLANHVAGCVECHSVRDYSLYAGPVKEGTTGAGGEFFDQKMGFPGSYSSKNITPYHLSDWSDTEIFHAITAGINKDGKALFPIMPYLNYGKSDPEDIKAIIAYIRTLDPIVSEIPDSYSDFPMNFIINLMPKEPSFTRRPDPADKVNYGQYMATLAGCADCHTPMKKGRPVEGMEFAGGFEFRLPTGIVRAANVTPHPETGIGNWSKKQFIQRFKVYADSSIIPHKVQANQMNTTMPWLNYAGMTEEDLGAIYEYLMSLKSIDNEVIKFTTYSEAEKRGD